MAWRDVPGLGQGFLLASHLFYRCRDLLAFFLCLLFCPQQSDSRRDSAAHDLVAGRESGRVERGERLLLCIVEVIECCRLTQVVPLAEIMSVIVKPVEDPG